MEGSAWSLALILVSALSTLAHRDATLEPRTFGIEVVEAVLLKLRVSEIFETENGLLRRIALVESNFGDNAVFYPEGTVNIDTW